LLVLLIERCNDSRLVVENHNITPPVLHIARLIPEV
jgi:hypothetical protein